MALYDLRHYRSEEQLATMQALDAAGICIFCPENLIQDAEHKVIHETEHWIVTQNKFPYEGTKLHLLLVPREHAEDLVDLEPAARNEYWTVLEWIKEIYGLKFYCTGSRNGDFRYTGSSVSHVHVHVIVGDVDAPGHEPVRFKMSSPADR